MSKGDGFGFAIELERNRGAGLQGFVRRIDGITDAATDWAPAFERIHKSFLAANRSQFTTAGKGAWEPLTARYAARKAARGQGAGTERASGALFRALTTGQGDGAITQIGTDEATFGTDLARAVYAQRGHGRRRRRLVVVGKARRTRWTGIIRDHLLDERGGR